MPKYPDEFESIWEGTGKRGGKEPALRAWRKVGKPTWLALEPVWLAYMLSEHPARGFIKDLSGWLNQGYHRQTWEPATARMLPVRAAPGLGSSNLTGSKNYAEGMDLYFPGKAAQ